MTIKEIKELKEAGFSLDEIKEIGSLITDEPKEPEEEPKPADDPAPDPEKDSSDHGAADNEHPSDDDQPDPGEPDYKKMYEELVEKNKKDAAKKDLKPDHNKATADLTKALTDYWNSL